MYLTFAAHNRVFQSVGVWGPGTASITGIAQPEQVNTAQISGGVLETLNVPALQGQWLTAADQDAHGLGRVMLSYGYWQRRFGGDPGVVGRTITVNSQSRVIAGVMPRGFKIVNYDFDLLVPLAFDPTHEMLAGFAYRGIARLRPGVEHFAGECRCGAPAECMDGLVVQRSGQRSALVSELEDRAGTAAAERNRGGQHPAPCSGW